MPDDAPVGIDPCVDVVFRKLFADPANEAILVDFLNGVLDEPVPITRAEVLNPFVLGEALDQREVIVDIRAEDAAGRRFIVEMQRWLDASTPQRMLYGAARVYGEQLQKGAEYADLRPVVAIWICERDLFPDEAARLTFRMREDGSGALLSGDLRVDVLQLSRWQRQHDPVAAGIRRWYGFFVGAAGWSTVPAALDHPALEAAMDVLRGFRLDPLEEVYRARVHAERVEKERSRVLAEAQAAAAAAEARLAEQQARSDALLTEERARADALLAEERARADALLAEERSRADALAEALAAAEARMNDLAARLAASGD